MNTQDMLLKALKEIYNYHYGTPVQNLDVNNKIKELERNARFAIEAAESEEELAEVQRINELEMWGPDGRPTNRAA